ncbi:MAG: SpvB/TcaC N-terminal domain-containing protein, partial [Woeseiaceae bacterium]
MPIAITLFPRIQTRRPLPFRMLPSAARGAGLNKRSVALSLLMLVTGQISAADWSSVGGTVPDAAWSGDTPALTGNSNVGALTGEGSVSGGAATYTIPVTLVPGRNELQPSVTLSYSSSSGNGIAGVGWNLAAGSSITRCGKTAAQDGATDKVHFQKSKDRLCLDGQRLVAVAGSYGNSGTEYRTELESFVKVVQIGDMDGTTTFFTVTHKSGRNDYFGQTADSRHTFSGIAQTYTWKINKSTDPSGNNTINFHYTAHGLGEFTLDSIDYTGQGSTPGDRYVTFEYETRPDVRSGYLSGGLHTTSLRLKSVTTKYQTQTVRQYRFSYAQSTTTGNSLLKSVEECGYDGATVHCFPPTVFEWYENPPVFQFERLYYVQSSGQKFYVPGAGKVSSILPKKDMNGDGTLD